MRATAARRAGTPAGSAKPGAPSPRTAQGNDAVRRGLRRLEGGALPLDEATEHAMAPRGVLEDRKGDRDLDRDPGANS